MEYPPKVTDICGRNSVMSKVIKLINNEQLVTIIGVPGIGKSAVCKNVVNFIAERRFFNAGVLYFSLKGIRNCEILIK